MDGEKRGDGTGTEREGLPNKLNLGNVVVYLSSSSPA